MAFRDWGRYGHRAALFFHLVFEENEIENFLVVQNQNSNALQA